MIVVIADAAQNAMAGNYNSITDGVLLIGTIVFWNVSLDWLAFRVPAVRRVIEPLPVRLIKDGAIVRRNMRKVLLRTMSCGANCACRGATISQRSKPPTWRTMAASVSSNTTRPARKRRVRRSGK